MSDQLSFFSNSEENKNKPDIISHSNTHLISADALMRFASLHPMSHSLAQSLAATLLTVEDQQFCLLTIMTLGHALSQGHVCIEISAYAGHKSLLDYGIDVALPNQSVWVEWLNNQSFINSSHLQINANTVIRDWDICRLHQGYLYFSKWADWEERLAHQLLTRSVQSINADLSYFKKQSAMNWQNVAAINSLLSPLSIVVGGPGTGKTTTVAHILEAVLNAEGHAGYNMVLAAPTGKAAARMALALNEKMLSMDISSELLHRVPKNAVTLHRLLAWSQDRRQYRYNKNHPLLIDCIVIDEASMIDLAMFTTLLEALPEQCRIILLGDPYQLASVSAGSVLSDICIDGILNNFSAARCKKMHPLFDGLIIEKNNLPLLDNCVMLQRSYRFDDNAGIGLLAKSVLNNNELALEKALIEEEVSFYSKAEYSRHDPLQALLLTHFQKLINQDSIENAFKYLTHFQLLCAIKEGDFSTSFYNQSMLHAVQKTTTESDTDNRVEHVMSVAIYHGMPLMMEKNHHKLGIYNGDIGLVWRENGRLRLYFSCAEAQIKSFIPSQIQGWAPAHAITVHKSQGSEYEEVAFACPAIDSPLLNKEMLYTAITRSKKHFYCLAELAELKRAMSSPCQRVSALPHRLACGETS